MTTPRLLASALAVSAAFTLSACSAPASPAPDAAPTSEPSSVPAVDLPALDELIFSQSGFAELYIGSEPPLDPPIATFEADACDDVGVDDFGVWTTDPAYLTGDANTAGPAFTAGGPDGVVNRIDINSDQIRTFEGIRLGSTREEVEAAYPDAEMTSFDYTDVYVMPGAGGDLMIEVTSGDREYWASSGIELDRVQYLRSERLDTEPYSVAGTDDVVGFCPSGRSSG